MRVGWSPCRSRASRIVVRCCACAAYDVASQVVFLYWSFSFMGIVQSSFIVCTASRSDVLVNVALGVLLLQAVFLACSFCAPRL